MMITSNVYVLSAMLAASSVFRRVAAQVPTGRPTSKKPTTRKPVAPAGTQPPNLQLMQITVNRTKEELVASLIAQNGDVEFKDVEATGNLAACAALYTGGHTLGTLMERGPAPDYELVKDSQGNYIPTSTNIVPNVGIILSSGGPRNFNWNDKDDETVALSNTTMTNHKLVQDLRRDVNNQSGNLYNSFFDACAISFKFRCTSNAYVPVVSFKYVFGSEEYYEYVDSAFNDAFGFYLNQKNIALIPTTTTNSQIVSINNVNYNDNKQYFNGNDPGLGWQTEKPDAPYSEIVYPRIEADGFTDILTARGSPNANPLTWNNMTLVVSDVGDGILDSWVVLESSSFTCVDITSAPSISSAPSDSPTLAPATPKPSSTPTSTPSSQPTTLNPTTTPTSIPTTSAPTSTPTLMPTTSPPTSIPSSRPTTATPTFSPSSRPTSSKPTSSPSSQPTTSKPSSSPSSQPTTLKPTSAPSSQPTTPKPSSGPTSKPTTSTPTSAPTSTPTTSTPTSTPTSQPTSATPTSTPSSQPISATPTSTPSTSKPTTPTDTSAPTSMPTTSTPTSTPSSKPTTLKPTSAPSSFPTTRKPTSKPTSTPTSNPSVSIEPSGAPSMGPSVSSEPSVTGSHAPSISSSPSSEPSAAGKVGPKRVWYDADEDGTEDITEDPLPGVNVTLWCSNSNGTFIKIRTVTTDANGTYEFDLIQPSTCYISVLPQLNGTNYTFSPVVHGGNQIYPNGTSPLGNVTYNSVNNDWAVGMVLPKADIGPNVVFNDLDKDGIQDVGEPPMAGVIVTLMCDGRVRANDTTGADGLYKFKNVIPGNCYISVLPKVDDNDKCVFSPITPNGIIGNKIFQNGTSPTITVVYNNATHNDWNVGMYLPPATIGPNKVFDDKDGDGFRDPNEGSLANVTVGLYCHHENSTSFLVALNVTNSDGEYVLYNVQPGACFIQVSPNVNNQTYSFSPIVPNGNQIHPYGTSSVVNVTWNDIVKNLDVGMYLPVTIGDKVWEDLNGNGLQDNDEAGKANVTVKLFNSAGATVATTTTDALGMYKFTNLPPGKYGVRFTLPPTYEFSPVFEFQSSPGGPDIPLSDAVFAPIILENSGASPREGHIPTQTLESGEISKTFDAGIYVPVIVGGTVFDDKNGNGIQDPGEPGLSGAKITATNTITGESHSIFSNLTGGYSLNLMPGGYIATIVPPSPDFTLSPLSNPGTANGNDFDPVTRSTQLLSLRSGQSGVGSFDAGFYAPVTIENIVWDDANANGIFDQGEVGYSGAMRVTLYASGSAVPFKNMTTAADGSFKFVDIPPGAYEIEFKKPSAGSSFTLQNAGNDDLRDSDVDPNTGRAPLTVVSGADISDITAGVAALPSIGPNRVFEDDDGDGILDAVEKGLPNVLVTLYNSTNSRVAAVLTDSNGAYSFVGLNPGTYYISVNKDPDFKFSPVVAGGNQISSSVESPLLNKSPPVTLAIGTNDKTLLVGMYEPATTGNKVWNDLNGDGIQQRNEPGLVDVPVHLYNKSVVRINSTKTDVDGHYIFSDLTPGDYSVKFILPDRFVFTVQAKRSFVIVDPTHPDNSTLYEDVTSDADRITGMTPFKFIKSGNNHYSFDAGMFIPITVNGTTWHDLNADGIKEEDEPGLASVVVTLYDYDGDEVTTTTTNADGVWKFEEMPPGTYHVKITPPTDPSGKVFMISPKPANQTLRSDFDLITMKSTANFFQGGSSSKGFFDAGLYLPATIGDRIWFDDTPNGIQDGDEEGYDVPITVNLYDALGYKVKETTSSDTGFYQFTGVKPGSYSVEFILSDKDYKFTIPNAGNNTDIDSDVSPSTGRASVTVKSGDTKTNIDAGVMDFGPYYPDWTNDVQICTNDGFDPSWLELQEVNYLYDNKEACCKQHFWWRMTQCMANEEFKFFKNKDKCDSKIYFEDWEHNSPAAWTDTTLFDTVEECCANFFWFDYDGCVGRSPVIFKFEFCVDINGLTDPQDCQSADIFANVIEAAINEGCNHTQGLSNTVFNDTNSSVHFGAVTTSDTNITKIGNVSLAKIQGTTVCGGSLVGQDFINEKTGTMPDLQAAANKNVTLCGVITVEEQECKDVACLKEHYTAVKEELNHFVNNGDLTLAINRLATTRLPPVTELLNVIGVPLSLTTQNLLLPATITGDINFKYFQGSNLETCDEKAVFKAHEVSYEKLYDCCKQHFQWNVNLCCAKGGGCPEIGVVASPNNSTNSTVQPVRFYPTWVAGQLCGSKPADQIKAWEQNYATRNECCEKHFNFGSELGICQAGNL